MGKKNVKLPMQQELGLKNNSGRRHGRLQGTVEQELAATLRTAAFNLISSVNIWCGKSRGA